jgi:glycosyltransferase involved in cell wall biosynthesis
MERRRSSKTDAGDHLMRIWLLNPYGPLPGEAWRETRYAMLGRSLARAGHQVIWWTAGFCHHSKTVRTLVPRQIEIEPNFTVNLVPTPSYKRHVGLARLRFEFLFALRVYKASQALDRPDVIVSSDVTMGLAQVAEILAKRFESKLIYDIIDLSPEVFAGALPPWLRSKERVLFRPLYALRARHFRRASAVVAVCDDYLNPARLANPSFSNHRLMSVYWGTDLKAFHKAQAAPSEAAQLAKTFDKRDQDVYAIYAGTLGVLYDIDALLDAAKLLRASSAPLKILIAGGGPRAGDIRRIVREDRLDNVLMLGEMSFAELVKLYQICDIGLSIYGVNSPVAMPIKIFDYLAAGLPIVNSIGGFLESLLTERQIGLQYLAGDSNSLASALSRISSDLPTLRTMAQRARDAAAQFDSTVQYGNFTRFIEQLAESGVDARRATQNPECVETVFH